MVSLNEVLKELPPFRNKMRLVKYHQTTDEIINEVIAQHQEDETDYDKIYNFFDRGNIYDTCKYLWDFCKYQLVYEVEPSNKQTVKTPAAILSTVNGDCKHYSLFIGGTLDAIKHNEYNGAAWDWTYRFASDTANKEIGHVFVVVFDKGKEIWVDPVLDSFNEHRKYTFYIDDKPMPLYQLSGLGNVGAEATAVDVDPKVAETSFLVMVNLNISSLKDILRNNSTVTYGSFRQWYIAKGFDFDHLMLIVNA